MPVAGQNSRSSNDIHAAPPTLALAHETLGLSELSGQVLLRQPHVAADLKILA